MLHWEWVRMFEKGIGGRTRHEEWMEKIPG